MRDAIGVVVGGSLNKTLDVRLDPGKSAALGQYVMAPLEGASHMLGMVTDVALKHAESGPVSWPPPTGDDPASALLREILLDTGVYTALEVNPYLEVPAEGEPSRARRLPRHFAPVGLADQDAMNRAFASEREYAVNLGTPLGMDAVEVLVDVEKLFERSAGIFGKSGTGKTVVAVQLLDALVAHSAKAAAHREKTVALIFDMHNDYGWRMKFEGGERRSLKQLHPSDVAVYSLEGNAPQVDGPVVIGTRDIEPDDLDVLQGVAAFTSQALEAARECSQRFGRDWVDGILADDPGPEIVRKLWGNGDEPDEVNWARVASRLGFHAGSLDNLRRWLRSFRRREFVQQGSGQFDGLIDHIVQTLLGGKNAVIQFGRHGNDLASYMLVANMLSRRIWDAYREKKERARTPAEEPNRLLIVIEEAHKFVDRSLAGQSIFGQIARELRKYNVTLLIIDQRPSQIDAEVLSQIGTKISLQLDSDADIEALVGGMTGRSGLRQIIASLESKQQALVFGHALPMPVVLRTPEFGEGHRAGGTLRNRLGVERGNVGVDEEPAAGLYGRRPGASLRV